MSEHGDTNQHKVRATVEKSNFTESTGPSSYLKYPPDRSSRPGVTAQYTVV